MNEQLPAKSASISLMVRESDDRSTSSRAAARAKRLVSKLTEL
jgi:hypothetical protein